MGLSWGISSEVLFCCIFFGGAYGVSFDFWYQGGEG